METNSSSTQPQREQLRQQWMEHAAAAFELMFGGAEQRQLVTLTQREERACHLSQDLAAWLLEQHVARDAAAQPEPNPVCCPKCQRPAQKVSHPSDADAPPVQKISPPGDATPPSRPVTTLAGEIEFAREQWRCPRCRIVFFSAR